PIAGNADGDIAVIGSCVCDGPLDDGPTATGSGCCWKTSHTSPALGTPCSRANRATSASDSVEGPWNSTVVARSSLNDAETALDALSVRPLVVVNAPTATIVPSAHSSVRIGWRTIDVKA